MFDSNGDGWCASTKEEFKTNKVSSVSQKSECMHTFFALYINNYVFLQDDINKKSNNIKYSCDWLHLEYCVVMQKQCQLFV